MNKHRNCNSDLTQSALSNTDDKIIDNCLYMVT